ncbi:SapB/AmfS family lanthipeptide [Streptomyces cinnamoneus]|nr:SapB/AmfS family lanthipeptide [Streptomyces cinnamoneus]PPT14707.1 SapB/AmfS family lantipeptide [Streptomyces cinnamoneus]
MVLLDLQVMKPGEGEEVLLHFGASVGASELSLLLCHDPEEPE